MIIDVYTDVIPAAVDYVVVYCLRIHYIVILHVIHGNRWFMLPYIISTLYAAT